MLARFLHLADVHLGTLHYGSRERARDFGRTLQQVADYAIEQQVNFVLVAGDLFDRAAIDAATHDDAHGVFWRLRRTKIPIFITEGNHDRPRNRDDKSWIASFSDQKLARQLDATFSSVGEGASRRLRCTLPATGDEHVRPGYVDLDGVRIVGSRFVGMQLPRACEAISEAIQELPGDPRYTIFMIHGGVEGIIPEYNGEIQRDQLSCLEPAVDYLALGHIHKPYTNLELDAPGRGPALENWARRRASTSVQLTSATADDAHPRRHPWILNPGSLDCWRMTEADWRHGFFDVEIDLDLPGRHRVKHVAVERRRVLVVRQPIDECASQSDLEDRLLRTLVERRDGLDPREPGVIHDLAPIVHVVLEGHLKFDRRHLDLNALEDQVRATFDPLVVEVKNQTRSIQYSAIDLLHGDGLPLDRAALEQQVLESQLANDIRLAPFRETLAGVALELKAYALGGMPDADLAERVLDAYRHTLGAEPSPVGVC